MQTVKPVDSNYALALQADVGDKPNPGLLLKTVYRLYRDRFRTWFAIIAPTSLLTAGILILVDDRIRDIYRSIPRGEIGYHWADVAWAMVLRFGGFFLSWLLGCFALGAIATEVNAENDEEEQAPWKHDAHQRTREHFAQVLSLAAVTFCIFLIGLAMLQFVDSAATKVLGWPRFRPFLYWVSAAGYIVVLSIVSWAGAAIPLAIKRTLGVWAALKRSIELSSGYEGAFFWLVAQTVAGSYAGWYFTHYLARVLLPQSILYTAWGYWSVVVLAVLASAAADPPVFIAFSLLADPDMLQPSSSFPGTQHPPDIHDLR